MPAIVKRPGVVTFVAVVMLILAGLALVCGICANAAAIAVPFIPDDGKPPRPEDPIGTALAQVRFIANEVPGYTAVTILGAVATLVIGILQLIAGIGLLKLRPAARKLAIIITVINLLYGMGMQVYTGALVVPAQVKFEKEKPRPEGMPDMSAVAMMSGMLSLGCSVAFQLTIAIVIIVGLNTQSAKIAFGVIEPPVAGDEDRARHGANAEDEDSDRRGSKPGEPRSKYEGYEDRDD